MKIVFFSSVLNHHQIPFCNEIYKNIGRDFTFVATMDMEEHRKALGYIENGSYPYLLRMHTSAENYNKAFKLSQEAEVMIAGVFPAKFLYERMKNNSLTFRYSERFFREGKRCLLSPRAIYLTYKANTRYRKKNLYMLCAGGYTAKDMKFIMSYPDKMYKWGYFPEFVDYKYEELADMKNNDEAVILWVGRFIECKHTKDAVRVAKRLKDKGFGFKMDIIGTGEMEACLRKAVRDNNLDGTITFKGSMKPEQVRKEMERANIFLFTSDSKEGWGAVLNEAMNSGCAVIASDEAGAVPFLLKNSWNGLIYKSGDLGDLFDKIAVLLGSKEKQIELGTNAYKTILETWNPKAAAERFLRISEQLIKGQVEFYDDGPMSKA